MGDALRTALRAVGQTLITLGVVVLLFCVYELKVTNLYTGAQQEALAEELEQTWAAAPARTAAAATPVPVSVPLGEGLAVLRVPRLGRDYAQVVLEGVSVPDLKRGPGHYPGTALPGELGNVVLSGHRTTYGAPFQELDELQPGDAVVLETGTGWFTYRMRAAQVVAPTAVEVTFPVPGRLGARPTERLLTLTTCHPEYSARERLIVTAVLDEALRKGPGVVPTALRGQG